MEEIFLAWFYIFKMYERCLYSPEIDNFWYNMKRRNIGYFYYYFQILKFSLVKIYVYFQARTCFSNRTNVKVFYVQIFDSFNTDVKSWHVKPLDTDTIRTYERALIINAHYLYANQVCSSVFDYIRILI